MSEGVSNIYQMGREEEGESQESKYAAINKSDPELPGMIRDALKKIREAKASRAEANAEIKEAKANLETKGCPKEMLALCAKLEEFDEPKRQWFLEALPIVIAMTELSPQQDLFGD